MGDPEAKRKEPPEAGWLPSRMAGEWSHANKMSSHNHPSAAQGYAVGSLKGA